MIHLTAFWLLLEEPTLSKLKFLITDTTDSDLTAAAGIGRLKGGLELKQNLSSNLIIVRNPITSSLKCMDYEYTEEERSVHNIHTVH